MRKAILLYRTYGNRMIILGVIATLGWFGFTGCVTAPSEQRHPIHEALIGKTKAQILACAGKPLGETPQGDVTALTYYKEAPLLEESFVGSKGSKSGIHHGCKAKVSLKDDRVTQVQYQSVPRGYVADDHCDEIFETCAQ